MRIIVVDDDARILSAMRRKLEDSHHEVKTVLNANSAMYMLDHTDGVQLVITDYSMPGGMNGLELAIAIRDSGYKMPIFLLTGSDINEEMAKSAGITQVFSKSRFGELLEAVENLSKKEV